MVCEPTWRGTTIVPNPIRIGRANRNTPATPCSDNVWAKLSLFRMLYVSGLRRSAPSTPPSTPLTARKTSEVPTHRRPIERWRPVPSRPAKPPAGRGKPVLGVVEVVAARVSASGRVSVIAMIGSGLYSSQPRAQKLVEGHRAEQQRDVRDRVGEEAHGGRRRRVAGE